MQHFWAVNQILGGQRQWLLAPDGCKIPGRAAGEIGWSLPYVYPQHLETLRLELGCGDVFQREAND